MIDDLPVMKGLVIVPPTNPSTGKPFTIAEYLKLKVLQSPIEEQEAMRLAPLDPDKVVTAAERVQLVRRQQERRTHRGVNGPRIEDHH